MRMRMRTIDVGMRLGDAIDCDDTEFVTLGDRDRGVTVLTVLLVERDFHRK